MDQPTRIATLVTLALAAGSATAEELTPIRVEATDPPRRMSLTPEATAADGGEALRELPGVDAIRMGGHGIDPVIRGQSGNRLNVLLGDGYAFGGCPNRMDPPSAYASPGLYDEMVVEKGVTGVTAGAGGPGGTVRFQRTAPAVSDDRPVTGRVGASGGTNGVPLAGHADVAVGSDDGYLRLLGEHKDADSYEDGNGDEVHSAWRSRTLGAVAGWTPDDETGLEVTVEENRQDHVLYAGSGMDVPESIREHAGLSGHWAAAGLKWEASLNASDVEHLMDNYTYRDAAMRMAAPTEAQTRDARLATTGHLGGGEWTLGVDALRVERDASRINKDSDTEVARMWPDVRRQRAGAFGEWVGPAAGAEWTAGLRVDRMSAEARAADETVEMNNTPSTLYADAYGTDTTDWDSTEVGGVVRAVWTVGQGGWVETGLSRSVRAPDATERFMAAPTWIGNPDLEAETHHQIDLGAGWRQGPWQARAALWYDDVADYIDRYKGANDETLYGNYDATLYGSEWEAGYRPETGAGLQLTAWSTYGHNEDEERPLDRIPPLKARLTADWKARAWEVAAHLTAAGEQDRIHDKTTGGQDPGETAGYAVLDLEGRWQVAERWHLTGGVRNVLDRAYHQHLQTGNGFDENVDAVNEPGRQAWIAMEVML